MRSATRDVLGKVSEASHDRASHLQVLHASSAGRATALGLQGPVVRAHLGRREAAASAGCDGVSRASSRLSDGLECCLWNDLRPHRRHSVWVLPEDVSAVAGARGRTVPLSEAGRALRLRGVSNGLGEPRSRVERAGRLSLAQTLDRSPGAPASQRRELSSPEAEHCEGRASESEQVEQRSAATPRKALRASRPSHARAATA